MVVSSTSVPPCQPSVWAQLNHSKRHRSARVRVSVASRSDEWVYLQEERTAIGCTTHAPDDDEEK